VIRRILTFLLFLQLLLWFTVSAQNAMIIVVDGARYSETFGAGGKYIPRIWNDLRPCGTIWTNFYNDGATVTRQGHSSIVTGTWQKMDNEGPERPTKPTIFEYFRKANGSPEQSAAVVVGKSKLEMLAYSTDSGYGPGYSATFSLGMDDTSVVNILKSVMSGSHPHIVVVNLPDVDKGGHSGVWKKYISAIRTADSLIFDIWQTLQADSIYRDNTTLFVTSDHGRHDKKHGGFRKHGDACEGCRHIMLLAVGKGFPAGKKVTIRRTQIDIAPTVGELLSFKTDLADGISILSDTAAK
jgi:hypothetical protein